MLPFIEMKGVRDITASVKERIKFDVPISGEPVPDIAWFKEQFSFLFVTKLSYLLLAATPIKAYKATLSSPPPLLISFSWGGGCIVSTTSAKYLIYIY